MKQTTFYMIVQQIESTFKYTAGFKAKADASQYKNEFGGVIEKVDCIFYKNFAEARVHKLDQSISISDFLSMSDEKKAEFKQKYPEIVKKLKDML